MSADDPEDMDEVNVVHSALAYATVALEALAETITDDPARVARLRAKADILRRVRNEPVWGWSL